MIISVIVHRCPHCNSEDICKNGHDYKGAQKCHCHRCKCYGTLNASKGYREKEKELILRTYQERASMRGVERYGWPRRTDAIGVALGNTHRRCREKGGAQANGRCWIPEHEPFRPRCHFVRRVPRHYGQENWRGGKDPYRRGKAFSGDRPRAPGLA